MIKGQKKLNVTYMAKAFDMEEKLYIEGETCMDVQMAEEYADLLLQDEEEVREMGNIPALMRETALENLQIIIDYNERLKDRIFIPSSIKGIEEIKEW